MQRMVGPRLFLGEIDDSVGIPAADGHGETFWQGRREHGELCGAGHAMRVDPEHDIAADRATTAAP